MRSPTVEPPLRVGVVGAGSASPEEEELAQAVGRAVAERRALLVCGGLGGVMAAAARGCAGGGGSTLGLLPGEDASAANPWVGIPVPTGLGEARNVLVVRAAEALVAVGGSWGTLSEIAIARKIGRPVITLGEPPAGALGLPAADGPVQAVEWALRRAGEARAGPQRRTWEV